MVDGWKDKKAKGSWVAGMEYTKVRAGRDSDNPATTSKKLRRPLRISKIVHSRSNTGLLPRSKYVLF